MIQSTLQQYIILFLILMFVAGCALLPQQLLKQEVQELVQQARDNFNVVESLHIYETYPDDFQEAQHELMNAETHLQANRLDQAYGAAQTSLAASQWILKRFYRDTIAQSAQSTKAEIETIAAGDLDNPLRDLLPELNTILDYSQQLHSDQQRPIDATRVLQDLAQVKQIRDNTQSTLQQTLESDVSFEPGEYELSDIGKHALEEFCTTLIVNKQQYSQLYPDKMITITLKVVGYTDQVDFRAGTNLLEKLVENVSTELPQTQAERREFLNQRLSEFRARTISAYIAHFIEQTRTADAQFQIKQEIIGRGEELPPQVLPPYPVSDPRRRICKIYSYISAQ